MVTKHKPNIQSYITMNINKLFLGLFFLLATGWSDLSAQKYSNEFLSIGVGARAQALGNAVIASSYDVTSGIWNPAGLVAPNASQNLQLGAMHSEWFAGVGKFDYLGVAMPFSNKNRRLAFSMVRFGVDQIPNTLSLYEEDGSINYDNITEFSAADYAFFGSYAQRLKTKGDAHLAIGGNVKVVRRIIGSFANSWGFGLDLSAQYRKKNLSVGLVLKDITTTFNAWSFNFTDSEKEVLAITNNEIPIKSVESTAPQILLGIGYDFQFKKIGVHPELDLVATTDGQRNTLISADPISIDPSFGLEIDYNRLVFLRAGVRQFQTLEDFDEKEFLTATPSFGVGLKLANFHIDYAFTKLGAVDNAYSHIISLSLDLKRRERP